MRAAIDFEDLSTRIFDFLTFRTALQDFQIKQMYPTSVNQLMARATDSVGNTTTAGTNQYVQIDQSFLTTSLLIITERAAP